LNLATMLQQQNDRAGALQRYREYLALQPRDADWEAVSAIARALEPAAVAPARSASANPVVVVASPTNQVRPLAVATSRLAAPAKPEVQTNVTRSPVTATPVPRVISNAAPPAPEVVKLAPEPVIKTTPDDKPATSSNPSVAAAVPSPVTASGVVVETGAPPRKGFLSKLNPFRREAKPTGELAAPKPIEPAGTASAGRYVYVAPAAPKAGDRKAAERELAEGQEAQRARRLAEALQHYRRAAAVDGSYFEAHYSQGLVAFEMRNFKSAAAAWETAIALRLDSADARYNFALTLKAADHPQDAADELEKLLALHPDEARGHLTLGNLYAERLGDKTRARVHYNRVLQLDPRNPQAQAIRYWLVANPG